MLVVDASVALKFVTQEPGSEAAIAVLAAPDPLIAPDWVLVECASGLASKARSIGLPRDVAETAFASLPEFFSRLHPTIDLLDLSFDLSFRLEHPIYDCLYLALALRQEAAVITVDRKFANSARRGGFGPHVRLLS